MDHSQPGSAGQGSQSRCRKPHNSLHIPRILGCTQLLSSTTELLTFPFHSVRQRLQLLAWSPNTCLHLEQGKHSLQVRRGACPACSFCSWHRALQTSAWPPMAARRAMRQSCSTCTCSRHAFSLAYCFTVATSQFCHPAAPRLQACGGTPQALKLCGDSVSQKLCMVLFVMNQGQKSSDA